ncbi:MAG: type II toxin-antitoxin system HicA family toxin [Oscillospiraceae bacterium]|nr:type II toxin-antitoxin system HicA family toxin [Oscillospiraceae bacterium]
MKSYSSREVIQMLIADGWYRYGCVGDHHHFKHPVKKGKVTVTHPKKDIPLPTLRNIERQSGINFP